jgi:hypothetical protein
MQLPQAAAVEDPNCRKLKLLRTSAAHFSPAVKRREVNACGCLRLQLLQATPETNKQLHSLAAKTNNMMHKKN